MRNTWDLARAASMAFLLVSSAAMAEERASGDSYAIERYTVDTGGGVSSGGNFSVQGTIGQMDAGPTLFGNPYGLQGGFWPGLNGPAFIDRLFRDRFQTDERGSEKIPLERPR